MYTKMLILRTILMLGSHLQGAHADNNETKTTEIPANSSLVATVQGKSALPTTVTTPSPSTNNSMNFISASNILTQTTTEDSVKNSVKDGLKSSTDTLSVTTNPKALTSTTSDPKALASTTSDPKSLTSPTSEPKSLTSPTSEPKSLTSTTSEPKSLTSTTSEPKSLTSNTSEPKSLTSTTSEPKSLTSTTSEPKSLTSTTSEPKSLTSTTSEPKSLTSTTSEPKTHNFTISEPKTHNFTISEPKTHNFTTSEPKPHNFTTSEPKTHNFTTSELKTHNFTTSEPKTHFTETENIKSSNTGPVHQETTAATTWQPPISTTAPHHENGGGTSWFSTSGISNPTNEPFSFQQRMVTPNRTGSTLERVCAQFTQLLNVTSNCNMAGHETNGVYEYHIQVKNPSKDTIKAGDFISKEMQSDVPMTSIAIAASCGALALILIAFAVYCSYHRLSYRKNQQHLTEELQTVENGYHDNPTLEVMEVQPEMQEKKVNGEFNDSWIVPIDNLAKDDIPDEEDTHL